MRTYVRISFMIIHSGARPYQEIRRDYAKMPTMKLWLPLFLLLVIVACVPQTPIPVYVTPTQAIEGQTTERQVVPRVPQASITPTPGPTETATPVATATPAPPTGTPLPYLDPSQMGVQLHTLLSQEDFDAITRLTDTLGLGWVKVQIDWKLLQPNGPGDTGVDFRRQELYLEDLKRRGHKVLASVARAPDWARSSREEAGPPDDPQVLVNFLNLMLNEFGNVIDAVEVWNEPNLRREWNGRPISGGEYLRYFRAARDAINAYSSRMQANVDEPRQTPIVVVTAGLAPTGNSPWSVDDRQFLRQMYNAGLAGLAGVHIGAHPFGWGNDPAHSCCNAIADRGWDDAPQFFFLDTLRNYRDIMLAYGDTEARIWVTEFGWPTWEGLPGEAPEPFVAYNDKWVQADYTLRAFQIGQQLDYVGPMFLWNMNFAWLPHLVSSRDERAAYSLLVPLQPQERPLFWMLFDAVRPERDLDKYD
ncbi:MAG: hypothetical protein OXB89_02560 [Anaerolineaceae bacterium]|nr:hypothetical protein [Anaerolineaceae bacterium]